MRWRVGVTSLRGTVFQDVRPRAGFETSGFVKEKIGEATVGGLSCYTLTPKAKQSIQQTLMSREHATL